MSFEQIEISLLAIFLLCLYDLSVFVCWSLEKSRKTRTGPSLSQSHADEYIKPTGAAELRVILKQGVLVHM